MEATEAMLLDEARVQLLLEEAGWMELPVADEVRVDTVVRRAAHEAAIKETCEFVFKGFPAVISSFMSVAGGNVPPMDADYRA